MYVSEVRTASIIKAMSKPRAEKRSPLILPTAFYEMLLYFTVLEDGRFESREGDGRIT
jgi:hypothetical protein